MLISPIDSAMWAGVGCLCTLLVGWAAERNGYLHLDLARREHSLNVTKALPRIGCTVRIEREFTNGPAHSPFYFVVIKIYNEGELPAQCLNGDWKLTIPGAGEKRIFPIQRDFLGKCQEYPERYKIQESFAWRREGVIIDVEVEFSYTIPPDDSEGHYHAKYHYTGQSDQTIKLT